jgi:hypothetical protein
MANMSYCRFQNTLLDLQDCVEKMYDFNSLEDAQNELSPDEFRAFLRMLKVCKQITENNEYLLENN